MTREPKPGPAPPEQAAQHRVRLPGFLVDHEIGLGDVIKRVTSAVGFAPCGGCEQRAQRLNHWVSFYRRR